MISKVKKIEFILKRKLKNISVEYYGNTEKQYLFIINNKLTRIGINNNAIDLKIKSTDLLESIKAINNNVIFYTDLFVLLDNEIYLTKKQEGIPYFNRIYKYLKPTKTGFVIRLSYEEFKSNDIEKIVLLEYKNDKFYLNSKEIKFEEFENIVRNISEDGCYYDFKRKIIIDDDFTYDATLYLNGYEIRHGYLEQANCGNYICHVTSYLGDRKLFLTLKQSNYVLKIFDFSYDIKHYKGTILFNFATAEYYLINGNYVFNLSKNQIIKKWFKGDTPINFFSEFKRKVLTDKLGVE